MYTADAFSQPSANTLIVPGAEWKPRQLVTRADDQGEVKVNEGPVHANADDQGEAKVDQGPVHAKDNGDIFFSVATGILDGN